MIKVVPLAVENPLQNYIWLIVNTQLQEAIVVDPTSAEVTQAYLSEHNLTLKAIWITHDHHDHIAGVASLKNKFPSCCIVAHKEHNLKGALPDQCVAEASSFSAWKYPVTVWSLEGHKKYHVGYLLTHSEQLHVFSGDILFSAGCGRNFEGSLDELYDSLQRLTCLPDNTLFYPTHEFTVSNLNFALEIHPNDANLTSAKQNAENLRRQNRPTLPTTLEDEKRINLFLRVTDSSVISALQHKTGLQISKPLDIFSTLRNLKDNF